MRLLLVWIINFSMVFWIGCGGGQVATHYEATAVNPDYQDEKQKLDKLYQDLIEELNANGLIYAKPELTEYINGIGNKLVPPELKETMPIRLYIVRDPIPNAFALDSGDIFINLGLLAFLENESQLGAVIAHEISHSIHRHGIQAYIKHKRSTITANIADIFLLGTGLSYLGAYASMAQHSRENEKEADISSFELMQKAGYDVREIPKIFEFLNHMPQQKSFMKSIYSSHPDNQQRITYLTAIVTGQVEPEVKDKGDGETYKSFQSKATGDTMNLLLYQHQYLYAEHLLNATRSFFGESDKTDYFDAEIHRLKAKNPESAARDRSMFQGSKTFDEEYKITQNEMPSHLEEAKSLYQKVIEKNPSFGSAYRGIGLIEWEQGDRGLAKEHLRTYLSLEQNAADRLYIDRLLGQ